ncbi:MAG: hypothetical protein MSK40_07760 [Parabacteroides sp.]|nr:hypothetical protein [Parabacteroides sp.]MCI7508678.1 hypothetical protein [Prevotella sp.]
MKKVLLLIALGFVMLSSCNNGQTKGVAEEIDSIALRAKTDTVLSFNGHTLGDTVIQEFPSSVADEPYVGYEDETTLTFDKWSYPVKYQVLGVILKSYERNHKIIDSVKVDNISIYLADNIKPNDLKNIVNLYTSRYGKYSFYAEDYVSPKLFPNDRVDSLSHDFYLKTFIEQGKGRIVWEWANCSITIEHGDFLDCSITYSLSGSKDRLKEEKKLESQAKHQDI